MGRLSTSSNSTDHLESNDDVQMEPLDPHTHSDRDQLLPLPPSVSNQLKHQRRNALLKSGAINVLWILTWYIFATFLSVYNKWMFSAEHYNFQYPLFVTSVHMIVQFCFAGTFLFFVPSLRPKSRPTVNNYIFKVLPCALATSLDIGLSNLSLKTITLSFYTMCKSSTLAFVLLFAFAFKLERPSFRLVGIIVIITSGVVLMVSDETEFAWAGFLQVMFASVFGGLRWALTEVLLRKEDMGLTNPFASIFFLAPAQAIILIIISSIVEGYGTIFHSVFFVTVSEGLHTIGIVLAGGALAFCMIMSEFFLIKRTSVMTLSVCGIFKEVATIFISTLVFGDRLTVVNIVGLCVTLFGIGLYNWLKIHAVSVRTRRELELEQRESLQLEDIDASHKVHQRLDDNDIDLENEFDTFLDQDETSPDAQSEGQNLPYSFSFTAESTPMLLVDGGYSLSEEQQQKLHPASS
ncbi:TPT-domain-containing protein [Hesseltinella vesiculosa]|uniref:TPT-domain-containing protein n=1 Tax=Hesseltinella vesiculosa TaxID=101127 RepID=A0A1X2GB03_9FUNG|nr:TPT-domain-containing protein [Hesseltinella vesiculosa]